jgi:hypothetical protein
LNDRWSIALQHESWRLADAVPPTGLSPEMTEAVQNGIRLAYVDAFRFATCISAAFVILSTLLAAVMLKEPSVGDYNADT